MIRSLVQRFNVSVFDRVTEVVFHNASSVDDVDLTVFRELESVSKPMTAITLEPNDFKQVDYVQKFETEMQRQASIQAEAELKNTFSKCQIVGVEKDNMAWRARINPGNFACQ